MERPRVKACWLKERFSNPLSANVTEVMFVLFARWKGAKCTTKHPMHGLRAYHMSLASLRPNQLSNWAEVHATHITRWDAHAAIADAPPFHGEMSYNDKYMVESQLKIMTKCEPNALKVIEEIGQLTLDNARTVGNTNELTIRRGQQVGGRQGHGGR
ncbi:hypothetical protein CFP56_028387 [Quercus suber]|uniref:Uncharacterized protein n=1 Tax=Quercus suber TaxID=58331 RepID=A0AAW0JVR8_QUESU